MPNAVQSDIMDPADSNPYHGGQLARELYTLDCTGFLIVDDFITGSRLDAIAEKARAFRAEVIAFQQAGNDLPHLAGWPLQNARCLYAVDPIFAELALDPRLHRYAERHLGEGYRIRDVHYLANMPDPDNKARGAQGDVNWHRDSKWNDPKNPTRHLMHAFVLLTDMTRENGATLLVPGTHNMAEPNYYFLEKDKGRSSKGNWYKTFPRSYFPASIQIEAKRGALVLINPMCIHTQGINVTDEVRDVVNVAFQSSSETGILKAQSIARHAARYAVPEALIHMLALGAPDKLDHYGPLQPNKS